MRRSGWAVTVVVVLTMVYPHLAAGAGDESPGPFSGFQVAGPAELSQRLPYLKFYVTRVAANGRRFDIHYQDPGKAAGQHSSNFRDGYSQDFQLGCQARLTVLCLPTVADAQKELADDRWSGRVVVSSESKGKIGGWRLREGTLPRPGAGSDQSGSAGNDFVIEGRYEFQGSYTEDTHILGSHIFAQNFFVEIDVRAFSRHNDAAQCHALLRQYAKAVIEGQATQLKLEFRFPEPPRLPVDDFRGNYKMRMPLGVSVVVHEESGAQRVPKANQKIRVKIQGGCEWMWAFPLGSGRIVEWPLLFEAKPGPNGKMVPHTTDANGAVFVDFREGYVLEGNGHRKVLEPGRLREELWQTIRGNEASLPLEVTAEAYEQTDNRNPVLATVTETIHLTHTAEIQWIKRYDPDETGGSHGLEILSKRIDPQKQSWQSLGRIRPAEIPEEELRTPIRLLPDDVLRLGRYDKVQIRSILDDAGAVWLMRGNRSFLGPQDWGEVTLATPGGPIWQDRLESWAREKARPSTAVVMGGAVTFLCALKYVSDKMTINPGDSRAKSTAVFAVGMVLTAASAGLADWLVNPSKIEWILIRPKGTVLGFDVGRGEARVYLLSGAADIEDLHGNQREVQCGQFLNVGGASHFQLAPFDEASLPESLKSLRRELEPEDAPEGGHRPVAVATVESWPEQWQIVATSPDWDGGGKPGFYADEVNAGAAVPPPGRHGIVVVHAPAADKPARLARRLTIPPENPKLRLNVAANHRPPGDWKLRATVDGTPLSADLLVEGKDGWRDVDYDLQSFAGREATVEIEAWATGWFYEYAFFDSIEITGGTPDTVSVAPGSLDPSKPADLPAPRGASSPPADLATALAALQNLGAEISGTPPNVHGLWLTSPDLQPTQLAPLASLAGVTWMILSDTPVSDDGLVYVAGLKSLRRLSLINAGVTDAGIRHLRDLAELRILHLDGNPITDAGLEHLHGLRQMETLTVRNTRVTELGIQRLKDAVPNVRVVGVSP